MKNVLTLIIFSLFISCIKQVSTSYPDDFSVPDIPIKEATLQASKLHDDAVTIKKWERNVGILKAQIFRMKLELSE